MNRHPPSLSLYYLESIRKCVETLGLLIQNAPNNQEKSPASKILSAEYLLLVLLYTIDIYILRKNYIGTNSNYFYNILILLIIKELHKQ